MESNAYKMESRDKRLNRFKNGSPNESISTLLNSIDNFFNNEIEGTLKDPLHPQTGLMFLGTHASALTIAKVFWDLEGLTGYKKFLEVFVDGREANMKFSEVADKIHDWRNVLAHQWLGSAGHQIIYDYTATYGWKLLANNSLSINPEIYCKAYLAGFDSNGAIWKYEEFFSKPELEAIKNRIIKKFIQR